MGGERSREENRRDAEDAWRDIERAVMCLDRERVVNYLKSLYNFTSDKCTRIFIADYLVDEIDDPGYRRLVVEALKNQAATSKCRDQDEDAWDDTRYVSDAWSFNLNLGWGLSVNNQVLALAYVEKCGFNRSLQASDFTYQTLGLDRWRKRPQIVGVEFLRV